MQHQIFTIGNIRTAHIVCRPFSFYYKVVTFILNSKVQEQAKK